ncbi:MAG: type 4a pilus biogenesis protein PilO [bacterium]|nr:type 4a pilus biogenesis protein PilO [bacterium]
MRRSVIIIICLFSAAVLTVGFVLPQKKLLDSLAEKIYGQKAELRSKEEYFSNLQDIQDEFKKYQTQLAKINSSLPKIQQLPAVFDFLQKASSQSGLVLKSVSPVANLRGGAQTGPAESFLSLVVSGSLSSFRNFISILEKSSRMIEVENISFSGQEGSSSSSFNLAIKIYFY